MSRSDIGQTSKIDRLDLMFRDKDVQRRKIQLVGYQVTLNAALGLVNLKSMSNNQEEIRKYEAETAASLSDIKGQIQGMQVILQYLGFSDGVAIRSEESDQFVTRAEANQALIVLNEHDRALKQCLQFLTKVYEGVNAKSESGISVLNAQSLNNAKQFFGNIGDVKPGPQINVDGIVAKDRSMQDVGNMDHQAARDFFK